MRSAPIRGFGDIQQIRQLSHQVVEYLRGQGGQVMDTDVFIVNWQPFEHGL